MLTFILGGLFSIGVCFAIKYAEKHQIEEIVRKQEQYKRFGNKGRIINYNNDWVWIVNDDSIQLKLPKTNIHYDDVVVHTGEIWELKLSDGGQIRLLKRFSE